jgi:hypothetical protein
MSGHCNSSFNFTHSNSKEIECQDNLTDFSELSNPDKKTGDISPETCPVIKKVHEVSCEGIEPLVSHPTICDSGFTDRRGEHNPLEMPSDQIQLTNGIVGYSLESEISWRWPSAFGFPFSQKNPVGFLCHWALGFGH